MIPFVILAIDDTDDRVFMTSLYLQYKRLMMSEILKIIGEKCDAEDILQASLVKLIEKIPRLRTLGERQRVNYLITTVKNTAYSALRRLKKTGFASIDDDEWVLGDRLCSNDCVEETITRVETVERLEVIWPMLDEKSRYLLSARYFLEMQPPEIAAELGIKPESVRMELTRARRKAKELLGAQVSMTDLWS